MKGRVQIVNIISALLLQLSPTFCYRINEIDLKNPIKSKMQNRHQKLSTAEAHAAFGTIIIIRRKRNFGDNLKHIAASLHRQLIFFSFSSGALHC